MPSVWLVTKGEYSDYQVVAVCSTKEKADALVASHNSGKEYYDYHEPREWGVDTDCGSDWHDVYISILGFDGSLVDSECYEEFGTREELQYARVGVPPNPRFHGASIDSAEHSLKLASEARQKWLRDNA